MEIATLGIDLSKTTFHILGQNLRGEIVLRRRLSRKQLLLFTTNRQPMLIGMEACGGAPLPVLIRRPEQRRDASVTGNGPVLLKDRD
jgi:transposase